MRAATTKGPMLIDAGVWIGSQDDQDQHHRAARELVLDTNLPTATLDLALYEIINVVARRPPRSRSNIGSPATTLLMWRQFVASAGRSSAPTSSTSSPRASP